MEVKKPYVQLPKSDNDEAIKLLTELVKTVRFMAPRSNVVNRAYFAARDYLIKKGVIEMERPQPRPPGGGEHLKIW